MKFTTLFKSLSAFSLSCALVPLSVSIRHQTSNLINQQKFNNKRGVNSLQEDGFWNITEDGTLSPKEGSQIPENLIIPSSVINEEGLSINVSKIKDNAFNNSKALKTVTFNTGADFTNINNSAFANCSSLKSVVFPQNIVEISDNAFENCYSLKTADLTVCQNLKNIKASAFSGCDALSNVVFPNSLQKIGNNAFRFCFSLTNISITPNIDEIGNYCFANCPLRQVVLETGNQTFEWIHKTNEGGWIVAKNQENKYYCKTCLAFGKVFLPNGSANFSSCGGITSITIANTIETLDVDFYECQGLSTIIFEANSKLADFSQRCNFKGCELSFIDFSDNDHFLMKRSSFVRGGYICAKDGDQYRAVSQLAYGDIDLTEANNVASDAFQWCFGVTSVHIGSNVTNINYQAFSGCLLKDIVLAKENTTFELMNKNEEGGWIVRKDQEDKYSCPTGLAYGKIDLKGAETINSGAFTQCYAVRQLIIPNTVKSISGNVWENCYYLRYVQTDWTYEQLSNLNVEGNFFNNIRKLNIYYKLNEGDDANELLNTYQSKFANTGAKELSFIQGEIPVPGPTPTPGPGPTPGPTPTPTPTPTPETTTSVLGPVLGAFFGGLALMGLTASGFVYLRYRRKKHKGKKK